MTKVGNGLKFSEQLLAEIRDLNLKDSPNKSSESPKISGPSFIDHLSNGIKEVNSMQKSASEKAVNLATGKEKNIHETMLAATHAGLNFNLMVQVRNKVLEAYQEVMRMPV